MRAHLTSHATHGSKISAERVSRKGNTRLCALGRALDSHRREHLRFAQRARRHGTQPIGGRRAAALMCLAGRLGEGSKARTAESGWRRNDAAGERPSHKRPPDLFCPERRQRAGGNGPATPLVLAPRPCTGSASNPTRPLSMIRPAKSPQWRRTCRSPQAKCYACNFHSVLRCDRAEGRLLRVTYDPDAGYSTGVLAARDHAASRRCCDNRTLAQAHPTNGAVSHCPGCSWDDVQKIEQNLRVSRNFVTPAFSASTLTAR